MANQALALRGDDQTGLAVRHSQVTEVQRLGGLLAASGYFADAREMAQAAVKVLAGEELGIPPVAAMMGMYIVKGKIMLSGNLIASRIRAHGYNYIHKQFDEKGCVLQFVGKKGEALGESSFTEADAIRAGCLSDMYKKFPRNMYFNRAISNGAKWYTPEVFAGAPVYVAEELGQPIDEMGDYVAPVSAPAPSPTQTQVAERKIAEMKAGKSYAQVSSDPMIPPAAPFQATDDDLPPNMGGPELSKETKLQEVLRTFTKFAVVVDAFASMKQTFITILPESEYYRVLADFGMKHGNDFKTMDNAKRCFSALWGELEAARPAVSE